MKEKKRTTSATIAAAKRMIMLIEVMRGHRLSNDELGGLLDMSPSGVRGYMRRLRQHGVLVTHQDPDNTYAAVLYALCDDNDKLDKLVQELKEHAVSRTAAEGVTCQKEARIKVADLLPGSHVHITKDDDIIPHRRVVNTAVKVQRDPLDQAFFGTGPARSVIDQDMAEVSA